MERNRFLQLTAKYLTTNNPWGTMTRLRLPCLTPECTSGGHKLTEDLFQHVTSTGSPTLQTNFSDLDLIQRSFEN